MSKAEIGLLGFGEVGRILAQDLPRPVATFDTKLVGDRAHEILASAAEFNIKVCSSANELAESCNVIISAVTAEQTETAAMSVSASLRNGAWFVDLNSASPNTKRRAAEAINSAGGRYVEVAVMSPVPTKRLATPLLLGGEFAEDFVPVGRSMGFSDARVFSNDYGTASAAKMCRSVMVKGIEALVSESLITARAYGVEDTVLGSLSDLFPGPDWPELSTYMIRRTLEHGGRRAEEMREVSKTVADIGLSPAMSVATVERQE